MKKLFLTFTLAIIMSQSVLSQTDFSSSKFEILEIEDAISAGDFLFAYQRVLPLAKAGHPHAEFILGTMNQNGWGMPQDYPKALNWYTLSGIHGSGDGAYNAGILALNGRGMSANTVKALEFFEMAARLNHAPALFNLGVIYAGGHGVTPDPYKSFDHYVKAGQLGHSASIYQVGRYFAAGHGTDQDYVKARQWFEAAATYHLHQAQYELALLHYDGLGGEADKIEALKWLMLAQSNESEAYSEKITEVASSLTEAEQNTARDAAFDWLTKFPKSTE